MLGGEHRDVGEPTDAELVADSLDRPSAFGGIFDRHATVLHRYLVRRVGAADADGLVGETFRIAFEKRSTFDVTRPSARPWLYGIATNLVARRQRSEARRLRATARLAATRQPSVDLAEQVTSAIAGAERWTAVAVALTRLPAADRDALLLHVWEGLPYEDVAAALDIPVGTVRSRLNRARRRLRELVETTGEGPDDRRRADPGRLET